MKPLIPLKPVFLALVIACLCLTGCEKKKEGKVEVTEKQLTIRKDAGLSWVVDASGRIKNVGEVDLKNIVVTGYCRSCGEVLSAGTWYISDVPKMSGQTDTINYLSKGAEEKFSFKDIAFYFNQTGAKPVNVPENIEIVIESFETVDK